MVRSIVRPQILGVVPARFASSRFPGKALAEIAGRSVIEHVFSRAREAKCLTKVVVATDDERIREEAERFGAPVRMTRADHASGTDRVAEVAAAEDAEVIVNIQGDEPLIEPAAIEAAVRALLDDAEAPMATLKKRIERADEITNPNVVKVVTDHRNRAIYFSRCPIPHGPHADVVRWKHIGLYVYRREFLLGYSGLPRGPLEQVERLEQLRALENGIPISVAETEYESLGVDTPEDLEHVRAMVEKQLVRAQN